jgi:predicted RNA-binding protein YlqC (UPF0109 family)
VVLLGHPFLFLWYPFSEQIRFTDLNLSVFYACMPGAVHYTLTLALSRERKGGNGTMKDLISDIVKALVDQPEQVTVTETEGGNTVVLELKVAKSDMGKVIGKRGRHADAIRTILSAAAGKVRKRYILEIVE